MNERTELSIAVPDEDCVVLLVRRGDRMHWQTTALPAGASIREAAQTVGSVMEEWFAVSVSQTIQKPGAC